MICRRSFFANLTGLGASAAISNFAARTGALAADSGASRESVAVLGTGHFGGAIGQRLAALGHSVIYGSRTPDNQRVKALVRNCGPRATATTLNAAVSRAGMVVFAVPWEAVKGLLPDLGDLYGKLIINPMIAKPKTIKGQPFPPDPSTSIAEQLQSWVPGGNVVSAFSTIWYGNLADPARAGGPVSVPVAGDDRAANEQVGRLISEIGLDPVIIGPLITARFIESLLWMEVAYSIEERRVGTRRGCEIYIRSVPI